MDDLSAPHVVGEALALLLRPFGEVVVHDLKKGCIEGIYHSLSKREVGDPSYLGEMNLSSSDRWIGPYEKKNWDGRTMKSMSVIFRDSEGHPQRLLCINIDVSFFEQAQGILASFFHFKHVGDQEAKKLFVNDYHDKVNRYVDLYCQKHQVSREALSRQDKKALILLLEKEGAFQEKHAAVYVGRVLGVSRATVYNYLREKTS